MKPNYSKVYLPDTGYNPRGEILKLLGIYETRTLHQVLEIEEKNLTMSLDKPTRDTMGNGVFIGPTLGETGTDMGYVIQEREYESMKRWSGSDSRFYSGTQTFLEV